MTVPDWWEASLIALASFRVWKLAGEDAILDRPREWATMRFGFTFETLIECPWCLGSWIAIAAWGLWEAFPHATLVVSAPLAIAAAVGAVGQSLSPD